MNTKIYKRVCALAKNLMNSAQHQHQANFDKDYKELEMICVDNEESNKDHPVQWETLADFTDDYQLAISIYEKALGKASVINDCDFQSSISFSLGSLKAELGDKSGAIEHLKVAQNSAKNISDQELKNEINNLLKSLS